MRLVALLTVTAVLLFQSCPAIEISPWERLETSLIRLGAREINFQGYCFLPKTKLEKVNFNQWMNQGSQSRISLLSGGNVLPGEGAAYVLHVSGSDHRACWKALQQQLLLGEPPEALAWMAETSLKGSCSDMLRLAEELLMGLEGDLYSIYRDENTINMVAYAPGFNTRLVMGRRPVNLNLELHYNRDLGAIRIRAGVPLLVSGLKI